MESTIIPGKPSAIDESLIRNCSIGDCREILTAHQCNFIDSGDYLQVGEIPDSNRWVLHISVIRLQFTSLLNKILSDLILSKATFKIPKDKLTARDLLDGKLGAAKLGKLICIYPLDDLTATRIAKRLVLLTSEFRSPVIPGNRSLGACVYVEFSNAAPPSAEINMAWPFGELATSTLPQAKPLLNNKYKILRVVKPDVKGRVLYANYFKTPLKIKFCIIKEGIKNMWADEFGRDITERLKWQFELHTDLAGSVRSPKILELFEESGNTYLAMEYIKGCTLKDKTYSLYNSNSHYHLPLSEKNKLIDLLIEALNLAEILHSKGYAHRDLTAANIIIDKNSRLFLIDMELTYSVTLERPDPAFKLGTPGYVSPEQIRRQKPSLKEDIYALGALMLFLFTGLPPVKFDTHNKENLLQALSFFLGSSPLCKIVHKCLSENPEDRPEIQSIKETLLEYQDTLNANITILPPVQTITTSFLEQIESSIDRSITSLFCCPKALSPDGIWICPEESDQLIGVQSEERAIHPGFYDGIAGILYSLAFAADHKNAFDPFMATYNKNWEYLQTHYLLASSNLGAGLAHGLAGIGIAISEGINSKLLPGSCQSQLEACFPADTSNVLDIFSGISGQGIALLHSKRYLTPGFFNTRVQQIVSTILRNQQKDGSWNNIRQTLNNRSQSIGLAHGTVGVLHFLIIYSQQCKDPQTMVAIQRGLNWLLRQEKKNTERPLWKIGAKRTSIIRLSLAVGLPGVAMAFIKAYEIFQLPEYRKIAEELLYRLPKHPISSDYSQITGLSGLGQVYIEAWRILKSNEWLERVNWITNVFLKTQIIHANEYGYWAMNELPDFVAGYLNGNAGITHFLVSALNQLKEI